MTIAEQLRNEGVNQCSFTKDELMNIIVNKIRKNGSTGFIIGRHVGTNLTEGTIGDCNPYNREYLIKYLNEEGFKYDFSCNRYGVEHITIRV